MRVQRLLAVVFISCPVLFPVVQGENFLLFFWGRGAFFNFLFYYISFTLLVSLGPGGTEYIFVERKLPLHYFM